MKLNLGCGRERLDGYVNLDLRSDVADFVGDAANLSFPDASCDEVRAIDLLEHFPIHKTQSVLTGWRRVLTSDGTLIVRVPNLQGLGRLISEDTPEAAAYIRNVYGGHRWGPDGSWDTHHTGWTPRLLDEALGRAGFRVLSNDCELNMTAVAECA